MFPFDIENLAVLGNVIAEYGPVARLWMGTQLTVMLTGPDELDVISFAYG